MQNYIFLIIFVLIFAFSKRNRLVSLIMIFAFSKRNRLVSLIMIVGYVTYIYIVNPVDSDKLYYILTASLDFFVGLFMVWIYLNKDYVNAKYIAYCSFTSFFVHIYGRIIYGIDADSQLYALLCILIVITKITLMLIRPLSNGIFGTDNRSGFICADGCVDQKRNIKMQTKKGCN